MGSRGGGGDGWKEAISSVNGTKDSQRDSHNSTQSCCHCKHRTSKQVYETWTCSSWTVKQVLVWTQERKLSCAKTALPVISCSLNQCWGNVLLLPSSTAVYYCYSLSLLILLKLSHVLFTHVWVRCWWSSMKLEPGKQQKLDLQPLLLWLLRSRMSNI